MSVSHPVEDERISQIELDEVNTAESMFGRGMSRRQWLTNAGLLSGVALLAACSGDIPIPAAKPDAVEPPRAPATPVTYYPPFAPTAPSQAAPAATRPPETKMEAAMRALPANPSAHELDTISKLWLQERYAKYGQHRERLMAGDPIAPILQDARKHYAIGIELAGKGKAGFIERTGDHSFRTERHNYDLQDATDLYLGGGIVTALVTELQDQNTESGYINVEQKGEIDRLKGSMTVQEAAVSPFATDVNRLAQLHRVKIALERGGKKLPPIWKPLPLISQVQDGYDPGIKVASFNPYDPVTVIYDNYLAQEHPDWFFKEYKPVIENRPARINSAYVDLSNRFRDTPEGKWTGLLSSYIRRGIELRRRIAWLEGRQPLEHDNLLAQYNVIKAGFGGWESNYAVMPTINDGQFSVGEVVTVRDLLADKHGPILLHPFATVDIDDEGRNTAVRDGFVGKLVEGPQHPQVLKDWQRATVFRIESLDRLQTGWMPIEWFQKQ